MRRTRRALLTMAVSVAAATAVAAPSGAAAPEQTGWWWQVQSVPRVTVPRPADVPEGGLRVESSPTQETAIAALRFALASGEAAESLTLTVAGERNGAALVLRACPTFTPWTAVEAGRWDDRPAADCGAASSDGKRAADGTTWTFDLRSFPEGSELSLVVFPAVPETGSRPAGQVTFTKPGDAALATTTVSTDSEPDGFAVAPGDTGSSDAGAVGGGEVSVPLDAPAAAVDLPTPAPPSMATPVADPAAQAFGRLAAPAPRLVAAGNAGGIGERGRAGLAALILFAGSAVAMAQLGGRTPPPLRPLGRLKPPATVPVTVEEAGLGRFVRPRVGRPQPLA